MDRLIVWRGLDLWLAEAAEVHLAAGRLRARGTQLGADPEPYRVDYELTTGDRWITERLVLTAHAGGGERRLDLRRAADGSWTANAEPLPEVEGALDCDLANSPLTNAMPVLREGLQEASDPQDFLMAWVSVPDLDVIPSRQRYEPVDGRTVRYLSGDGSFVADLELDEQGLVVRYPQLAEAV
jgi:uncharacterized protein